MDRRIVVGALLLSVAGVGLYLKSAMAVSRDLVVLTVGDEKITDVQFQRLLGVLPGISKDLLNTETRQKAAEQVVRLKALAQVARQRALDHDAVVAEQMHLQVDQVLATAVMDRLQGDIQISPEAISEYYAGHGKDFETIEARHILISFDGSKLQGGVYQRSEEAASRLARRLKGRLDAGADFGALARAYSDDSSSGPRGGNLGIVRHGGILSTIESVAFSLQNEEASEPVKTEYGFHIVQTMAHLQAPVDAVADEIRSILKRQEIKKRMQSLVSHTRTSLNIDYFRKMEGRCGKCEMK